MDSVGPISKSEDPPPPRPASLLVNLIGTGIALLTLALPTVAITYYSGEAATATPSANTVAYPARSISPSP